MQGVELDVARVTCMLRRTWEASTSLGEGFMMKHRSRRVVTPGRKAVATSVATVGAMTAFAPPAMAAAAADAAVSELPEASHAEAVTDEVIISHARVLSSQEVRAADVTADPEGSKILEDELRKTEGLDTQALYRVFRFGDQTVIAEDGSELIVVEGRNAQGQLVYQVGGSTGSGIDEAPSPGYASPSAGAYQYHADQSRIEYVGTWRRQTWWQVDKANNWAPVKNGTPHDYYRFTSKTQFQCTDCWASEGYKRAWLEADMTASVFEYEPGTPAEPYPGNGQTSFSVGYSSSFSVSLGVGIAGASAQEQSSWGITLTKSTENFHPVDRNEEASGGAQWCRYESAEYTGSKLVPQRQHARVSASASIPVWDYWTGQADSTSNCPTQI